MEMNGKRRITQEDLKQFRRGSSPFDGIPSVETFLLYWLEHFIKDTCKRSTYLNFRSYIESHICPVIGDNLITEVTTEFLQYFVDMKLKSGRLDGKGGLSPKTVREYVGLLRSAFKKAVEIGLVIYNPCSNLIYPKEIKKEIRVLNITEQRKISDYADPEWKVNSELTVLMGEYAGLRIGEVAGLKIRDIDLNSGMICIERSLNRNAVYAENDTVTFPLMYGSTKNKRNRIVPMSVDLKKALSIYFETMPSEIKDNPDFPLFLNSKHKAMEPRLINYHFKNLMRTLNISDIHFHSLRHTFATRALEVDMNIKTCSAILGHSSTQITSDIYTHVTAEQLTKEIKKLNLSTIEKLYL